MNEVESHKKIEAKAMRSFKVKRAKQINKDLSELLRQDSLIQEQGGSALRHQMEVICP